VTDAHATHATRRLLVVLGCLGALAPLAVDMYLPGWPDIQRTLHSSASAIQLTLTAFLLGIAAGQFVAGPLSDRIGRRLPLLGGVACYAAASVLCALAPSIEVLILLRFVQGFSGGASISVARAVVRDLGDGEVAARNYALLALVNFIGPVVAPVAGGQLLRVTDWRGVFVVLGAAAAILLAVALRVVRETLPAEGRHAGGLRAMASAFGEVGRDRVFLGYATSSGLVFAALLAYIAGSSFVLQDVYGLSPQAYSLFFAANGVALIAATFVNRRLIGRVTPRSLMVVGLGLTTLGAAILALAVAVPDSPVGMILPAFLLIVTSIGLVQPNATTLAMEGHPRVAGSASALLGLLQSVGGAVVAPLVGIAGTATAVPLAILVAVLVAGAWVALLLTRAPRRVPLEAPSAV
jgi:MFS transporter, DHA1 family, multidrug resistance protein